MARKKNQIKIEDVPMKTYFVERSNGRDQRVSVPSAWKVTFGPLTPGSKDHASNGKPCLRFYESNTQQRMVITDVVSFRDTWIKVEEKRISGKRQTLYRDTPDGRKDVVVEANVEEWVNPDSPQQGDSGEEFFRLNAPKDVPEKAAPTRGPSNEVNFGIDPSVVEED